MLTVQTVMPSRMAAGVFGMLRTMRSVLNSDLSSSIVTPAMIDTSSVSSSELPSRFAATVFTFCGFTARGERWQVLRTVNKQQHAVPVGASFAMGGASCAQGRTGCLFSPARMTISASRAEELASLEITTEYFF